MIGVTKPGIIPHSQWLKISDAPTENGFLLSKDVINAEIELTDLLKKIYSKEFDLIKIGIALKETVVNRFSINKIYPEYEKIHKAMKLI